MRSGDICMCAVRYKYNVVINVMTLWKIFAVDTQFKQLRKRKNSNPAEAWIFFRLLFRNCLNCVSTAKIFHNVITHNRGTNPVTIMLYYPQWHDGPLKLTGSQQLWLHSSVGRALHRYRRGHGFESRWSLNFFQASLSQLLKLRINREDLS